MQPANILFEKLIQDGSIDNNALITLSESRRSLFHNMYHEKELFDHGKKYYEQMAAIMKQMEDNNSMLSRQPLFQWDGHSSNSWLYEKLNMEVLLAESSSKRASTLGDLKQKRIYFKEAVKYAIEAINTLQGYNWEDVSLKYLPIFQDRFHIHNLFKYGSQYYSTMNDYSMKEKNAPNEKCIRLAYQMMDIASNVWEHQTDLCDRLYTLKTEYALSIASRLEDDNCGEKVALLKPYQDSSLTPEYVKAEYTKWKQQNDQVYYGKEQTDIVINPSSLESLFQSLPDISVDL